MKNIRMLALSLLCLASASGLAQAQSTLYFILNGAGGPDDRNIPLISSDLPGGTQILNSGPISSRSSNGDAYITLSSFHSLQDMLDTTYTIDGGYGGISSGTETNASISRADTIRARNWDHVRISSGGRTIAGGFWGPNGVSGSDGALNMIGNLTLGMLGRTGWSNWWQETGCQSGQVCLGIMATSGLAEGELPIRGSALRASGEFSPDFDHIFNTQATFIRSNENPLPGIFSARHLVSRPQGARAGVELYSEYLGNMDGTGMWRYSNHVGLQNSTDWWLDDMSGFDLDPASGLWINKNPVLGFTRYRDMNLFFPPRSR